MKKKRLILLIVIMIVIILGVVSWLTILPQYSTNRNDYYYSINSLIKDYSFSIAKIEDDKIVLYGVEGEQIDAVDFKKSCDSKNPIYIRKYRNNLFFVENVAIDDENGILFINDNSNEILDGIWSIKRVGGNSYKYSTSK